MATRAEQFRYAAERTHTQAKKAATKPAPGESEAPAKPTKAPKSTKPAKPTPKGHAARKATVAREPVSESARPSRKSTRKSENRTKTDTSVEHSAALQRQTPESRYRQARDKGKRARGS